MLLKSFLLQNDIKLFINTLALSVNSQSFQKGKVLFTSDLHKQKKDATKSNIPFLLI